MIAKLYLYFGVPGILSIVVWMIALVFLVISSRRQARSVYCFLALGVAAAGWILAVVNSDKVSAIELDRRDEQAAMMKARKEAEANEEMGAAASSLKFAEGDPEETVQEYRKRGKQMRDKGKNPAKSAEDEVAAEEPEKIVKYLREDDYNAANRLDRLNLLLARLIFWLAVGRVVMDYLRRLNSTEGSYLPVPISGRWLDHLVGKTYSVLVMAPALECMTSRAYAERVIRNGDSFIYFGETDPWLGRSWLPRLSVGRWPLWRLPKLDYGDPGLSANGEYVLDAAWFNRCGVVVSGEDSDPLFDYIAELIARRHEVGGSARRTVHLIWDLPQLPSEEILLTLVRIAPETNLKMMVWANSPVEDEFVGIFEECL
jgi:hypothetical protein